MSTITKRVAAGAAFLDEHDPGWWRVGNGRPIDLATLDLSSESLCVLGQRCPLEVLRSYEQDRWGFVDDDADDRYMAYAKALSGRRDEALVRWAYKFGFSLPWRPADLRDDLREWPLLTGEWKRVITGRRSAS